MQSLHVEKGEFDELRFVARVRTLVTELILKTRNFEEEEDSKYYTSINTANLFSEYSL